MNRLQKSVGDFVSMNSFFSTSRDRQVAGAFFLGTSISDDPIGVLFEIEINENTITKPSADISMMSYFEGEEDILFALGTVFRIMTVEYKDHDAMWIIRLKLCSDDDNELKAIFAQLRSEVIPNEDRVTFYSLAYLLWKIGKFDKAAYYFNLLLTTLPEVEADTANCYKVLGLIAEDRNNYDNAISYQLKALEVRKKG